MCLSVACYVCARWPICVLLSSPLLSSHRAISLDNTLIILSTVAPDAGRYYAQAVNDKNGENKTSLPVTLTVESEYSLKYTHTHTYTHKNRII